MLDVRIGILWGTLLAIFLLSAIAACGPSVPGLPQDAQRVADQVAREKFSKETILPAELPAEVVNGEYSAYVASINTTVAGSSPARLTDDDRVSGLSNGWCVRLAYTSSLPNKPGTTYKATLTALAVQSLNGWVGRVLDDSEIAQRCTLN
jgi:predicted small lipoprotein YifL